MVEILSCLLVLELGVYLDFFLKLTSGRFANNNGTKLHESLLYPWNPRVTDTHIFLNGQELNLML